MVKIFFHRIFAGGQNECSVRCLPGHAFSDGTTESELLCHHGVWDAVEDCKPVCDPPCQVWYSLVMVWLDMAWFGYGMVCLWYGLVMIWFVMVWYGYGIVSDPPCQNGGRCLSDNQCLCGEVCTLKLLPSKQERYL